MQAEACLFVLWGNTGQNLEVTECPDTDISFQILPSLWNLARLHLSQLSTFQSVCQDICRAQIYFLTYRGHLLCPCSPTSTQWLCITQLHQRLHQLLWVSRLSENKCTLNLPLYNHCVCLFIPPGLHKCLLRPPNTSIPAGLPGGSDIRAAPRASAV